MSCLAQLFPSCSSHLRFELCNSIALQQQPQQELGLKLQLLHQAKPQSGFLPASCQKTFHGNLGTPVSTGQLGSDLCPLITLPEINSHPANGNHSRLPMGWGSCQDTSPDAAIKVHGMKALLPISNISIQNKTYFIALVGKDGLRILIVIIGRQKTSLKAMDAQLAAS